MNYLPIDKIVKQDNDQKATEILTHPSLLMEKYRTINRNLHEQICIVNINYKFNDSVIFAW